VSVLESGRLRLAATVDAPFFARRAVSSLLFQAGRRTSIPMVELVVSEIVANAAMHAVGPVDMTLTIDGERLRVEVTDCSPDRPLVRRVPGPHGGFGLPMIDSLSEVWGACTLDGHKTVWADLDLKAAQDW
jgi:anti-sigma regulatory factor (Ser/Thr protein kinase)